MIWNYPNYVNDTTPIVANQITGEYQEEEDSEQDKILKSLSKAMTIEKANLDNVNK